MSGQGPVRAYALKPGIADPRAAIFELPAQRTMYGGKHNAAGDTVFLFASENEGGTGLFARGMVVAASPVARTPGVARQTPGVDVSIRRTALACGRWDAGSSNRSATGPTACPGPSSTSSSTGRRRTRSSA